MRCYHVFIQIKRDRTWVLKKNNHFLEAIGDIRVVIVTLPCSRSAVENLDSVIYEYELLFVKKFPPEDVLQVSLYTDCHHQVIKMNVYWKKARMQIIIFFTFSIIILLGVHILVHVC